MSSLKNILTIICLALLLCSCKESSKDIVKDTFIKKVVQLGFKIDAIKLPDEILISKDSLQFKLNISNLRKQYELSPHEKTITDFVNLVTHYQQELPAWIDSKKRIFYYLYPSNYDFKHFVHVSISQKLSKIYVYSENGKLTWITKEDLMKWKIDANALETQSQLNSKEIFSSLRLELDTLEGHRYISIESNRPSFNSSFILCNQLKDLVSGSIGWPIYAITPCRDQMYLFGESDFDFMKSKLKNFVLKKYKESNDPLSLEILQLTDKGIKEAYEF